MEDSGRDSDMAAPLNLTESHTKDGSVSKSLDPANLETPGEDLITKGTSGYKTLSTLENDGTPVIKTTSLSQEDMSQGMYRVY